MEGKEEEIGVKTIDVLNFLSEVCCEIRVGWGVGERGVRGAVCSQSTPRALPDYPQSTHRVLPRVPPRALPEYSQGTSRVLPEYPRVLPEYPQSTPRVLPGHF